MSAPAQFDWLEGMWTPPVIGPPPYPELPDECFDDDHSELDESAFEEVVSRQTGYVIGYR